MKISKKSAGYSGTPLAKKLGIKDGACIRIVNAPENYLSLFTDWPANVQVLTDKKAAKDLVHYFTMNKRMLEKDMHALKKEIYPTGILWVSWPKKAAKITTDITEDIIRKLALENALVDTKVCAIDETWSGLKLVVPIKFRNQDQP